MTTQPRRKREEMPETTNDIRGVVIAATLSDFVLLRLPITTDRI